jgi:PEP-CTERM motif
VGLLFGNGDGGETKQLFFRAVAGPHETEDYGLFGDITAVPEPSTWAIMGFAGGFAFRKSRRKVSFA